MSKGILEQRTYVRVFFNFKKGEVSNLKFDTVEVKECKISFKLIKVPLMRKRDVLRK